MSDEPSPEESAAPAEGAEAKPPEPPKVPEDPPTGKHDLRKLGARAAKRRRRETSAELSVRRPKAKEFRLSLDRDSTIIGRDARCDIVLGDDGVSRRHARIDKTDAGYFELVDLSSTNGTLVDGRPVSRMLLLDGDRFTVGDTRFVIHVDEPADEG